jgi:cellulose synthase/poly-beta-1,6-N-acetylglucosamine synthase-like glycosyltransferase
MELFFWISGGLLILTIVYLFFLAVVGLLPEEKTMSSSNAETRFAILIPAHNEAQIIGRTLKSIDMLDYPSRLYATWVIADNCSDETQDIAQKWGGNCLERIDNDRRGKGFALKWAFEQLRQMKRLESYDAFIIIDADTIVSSGFLRAMDARVARGELAIQGYYDVIEPEASPMASLSYLGFFLSRNLRYRGRTRLGWSSNLLGNGMCFSKDVISQYGWPAISIVEDMEYAVMLQLKGTKITFAPEARVFAEIPGTFKDARVQRSRWDIGRFQVRNKYVIRLIKETIKQGKLSYLDTAMELLIPPFSLFVTACFVLFGLFLATTYKGLNTLSVIWFIIPSALTMYVLVGIVMAKASWRTYKNLIYAPFFLIWRVTTVCWGYFFSIGKQWIKTSRKQA